MRFGRWTVIGQADQVRQVEPDGSADATAEMSHTCRAFDLRNGKTKSCGCLKKGLTSKDHVVAHQRRIRELLLLEEPQELVERLAG